MADVGETKKSKAAKLSAKEAKDVADAVISVFNTAAVTITELPEAELSDNEAEQIHEPLERIIQRMSPSGARRFQALTDPITLLVCMGVWANRVIPLVQQRNMERARAYDNRNLSTDHQPFEQPASGRLNFASKPTPNSGGGNTNNS